MAVLCPNCEHIFNPNNSEREVKSPTPKPNALDFTKRTASVTAVDIFFLRIKKSVDDRETNVPGLCDVCDTQTYACHQFFDWGKLFL